MKDPDRLRATFARAFGPLVLTPSAEGYHVAGNIKAPEIRAGSGGLSPSNGSCGGAMVSFLSTARPALSLPVAGRIYRNRVTRGLRGALLPAR
jgi:hypothetical protein